ncbi:MAG TPA: hypothetical protein VFN28_06640 [Amaricoccus sp.]|nr:hypothetical protein [Amaricoccus sp.]
MTDPSPDQAPAPDPALNPSLRQRREQTHDTTRSSLPPAESASVQREEGKGWPAAWLIVTIVCVVIGIYLIFF